MFSPKPAAIPTEISQLLRLKINHEQIILAECKTVLHRYCVLFFFVRRRHQYFFVPSHRLRDKKENPHRTHCYSNGRQTKHKELQKPSQILPTHYSSRDTSPAWILGKCASLRRVISGTLEKSTADADATTNRPAAAQ
jgi:hypothetical protein